MAESCQFGVDSSLSSGFLLESFTCVFRGIFYPDSGLLAGLLRILIATLEPSLSPLRRLSERGCCAIESCLESSYELKIGRYGLT